MQINYVWSHRKLDSGLSFKTKEEIIKNNEEDPFNKIGSEFYCTYFPKNKLLNSYIFGYYITTGTDYNEVLERMERRTKTLKRQLIEEVDEKDLKKKNKGN